jgi:hypothetical protein
MLTAEIRAAGQRYRAHRLVDIGRDPVEGADIVVTTGFEIRGKVRLVDSDASLAGLAVMFRPPGPFTAATNVPRGEVQANGDVALTRADPEPLILNVNPLPSGHYIQAARLGQTDILASGIDLSQGLPGSLDIVISGKAASVGGTVRDGDGRPVDGAVVALIPEAPERRLSPHWVRSSATDGSGGFRLEGLIPGEYRLYAWEAAPQGAWTDPAFLRPFEAQAKRITLRESSNETADLTAFAGVQ